MKSEDGGRETGAADLGSVSGHRINVLLVEDDKISSVILSRLLSRLNYSVQSAGSVAEALSLMTRSGIDIMISDIQLPDGTGCDLMRAVQKQTKVIGIAISGYDDPEDFDESFRAGFLDHLVKPIDFEKLKKVLANACFRLRGDGV